MIYLSISDSISLYIAAPSLVKRKWNWRKWTRIRSFWLGELLKSEMVRTHRSRRDASKSPERQLRNSKVEGKTWAIGSTERCPRKENAKRKEWQWGRAKGRTIEFKSIGKIRDDETRQKEPQNRREGYAARWKKINFELKYPRDRDLSPPFSFSLAFSLILRKMSLNAFSRVLSV